MRRFILLILFPALLLAGAVLLSRAAADWRYVTTAAPGEVMFVATFDDFLDDWELYDDGQLAAQVVDGALSIEVRAPYRTPFSAARPVFADFDLRVSATAVSGTLNNGFGVLFRMRDRSNYLGFFVSSDGYYQARRAVNGVVEEISVWIPSQIVNFGLDETNELRVVARQNDFSFYVNGEPALFCIPDEGNVSTYNEFEQICVGGRMSDVVTDTALPGGQIALAVETFDEAGVVVRFDNVVVTAPLPDDRLNEQHIE